MIQKVQGIVVEGLSYDHALRGILTTFCLVVIAGSVSVEAAFILQRSLQYQILAAISIECIEVESIQAWRLMVFC